MDRLLVLIEQLIRVNPTGLQLLLYEYSGYSGPLDVEVVVSAYVLFGDLFLVDLYRLFSFENFEGENPSAGDYNKFQQFWKDATGFISGVGAIAKAASNDSSEQAEILKQKRIWNTFIWTGILSVTILLIFALIIHRKK